MMKNKIQVLLVLALAISLTSLLSSAQKVNAAELIPGSQAVVNGDLLVDGIVEAKDIISDNATFKKSVTAGSADIDGSLRAAVVSANILRARNKVEARVLRSDRLNSSHAVFSKANAREVAAYNVDANTMRTHLITAGEANIEQIRSASIGASEIEAEAITTGSVNTGNVFAGQAELDHLGAGSIQVRDLTASHIAVEDSFTASNIGARSIASQTMEVDSVKVGGQLSLGDGSRVDGPDSVALGPDVHVAGNNVFAIGSGIENTKDHSLVIGFDHSVGLSVVSSEGEIRDDDELEYLNYSIEILVDQINHLRIVREEWVRVLDENSQAQAQIAEIDDRLEVMEEELRNLMVARDQRLTELLGGGNSMKVGIGTIRPEQSLHISGAMKLEPMKNPPVNPSLGTIFMSSTNAVCVYLADGWEVMAGDGDCVLNQTQTNRRSRGSSRIGSLTGRR